MIRILHIVHSLTKGGGLSNLIMNYYRKIDRDKIQFDFIYFRESESDFRKEIEALGGRYYRMKEPVNFIRHFRECNEFFKEHEGEYAAIHCHALFAAAAFAPCAKKHGIKNIIVHSHNFGYGSGFFRKIRNYFFVKISKSLATCKLSCSHEAAEFMFGKKAVERGEVTVIGNAVECEKYFFSPEDRAAVRKELGIENSFAVGHVGGFAIQKNHKFLVEIFAKILEKRPDAVLILVGGDGIASGSTRKKIMKKVSSMGFADKVKFLGVRSDVGRLMSAMDVFVFPSLYEGFGISLLEAQLAGLPCFASERTSADVQCADDFKILSLKEPARVWAEEIAAISSSRERSVDISRFDKFNVEKQKNVLENIYYNISGEDKPIRVLHIVHALTRGGGLSNVVMNYYRFINREKVQFDFLYFREVEDNFKDEIEKLGGRYFKMSEPNLSTSFNREKEDFFKKHSGEWKYIHCHALFAVSVFEKTARKYGAEKIIAHSHNTIYGTGFLQKIRNYVFVRMAERCSDYHFACSEKAGRFMFRHDENPVIMKNAIDLDNAKYSQKLRENLRSELEISGKYVIGHIGGFTNQKNHKMIIEIFKEFSAKHQDAVLMLIGGDGIASGSTKAEIVELAEKYNISDKVKFMGLRKDAAKLLSAMDIFIMPSFFEGLPVSCVEAQANGLPLILSDRITKEIGIYQTEFLSIDNGVSIWLESIEKHYREREKDLAERAGGAEAMQKSGYNILTEAKKLKKFYLTEELM